VMVAPYCSADFGNGCPTTLNDNIVEVNNSNLPWTAEPGSFAYELDGTDPVAAPEPRGGIALFLVVGFIGCAIYRVSRGSEEEAREKRT